MPKRSEKRILCLLHIPGRYGGRSDKEIEPETLGAMTRYPIARLSAFHATKERRPMAAVRGDWSCWRQCS
jgi:hypothetical protein